MDYRNRKRTGKFYREQVERIYELLVRYVKQSDSSVDVEKYLRICEQLGEEPDPERMPIDLSGFPEQVQTAFFMFGFLPDVWEGMSGTYMGKDYTCLEYFMNLYEVEDVKEVLMFIKMYENLIVQHRAEKAKAKMKADKRRESAGSGKNYAHSVKG